MALTPTNIAHYRGDSLALQLTLWSDPGHTVPTDLSTAVVTAQVREDVEDAEVVASFEVAIAANVITAILPPASARLLPALSAYDVEIDWFGDDSVVQTVVAGKIAATADVTRWRAS